MKRTNKKFSAPTAWKHCGASMRRAAMTLLTIVMAFTAQTAWADYGWYDVSMSIGGITTDPSTWSGDPGSPTNLGIVSDMTITSIAFNIWNDNNDRGGANMYFRVYDKNGQVGSDQDLWLFAATRIEGKDHDFAISYTTPYNLASAVGLTSLVPGKDYFIDLWAKSYGSSGDEWYSNGGANYHAKLTIAEDVTSVTISPTSATLPVGQTQVLAATVLPDNSIKTVTWSTSDADVATVSSDGTVTAVGIGSCAITATATNGTDDTSDDLTATCTVTVVPGGNCGDTSVNGGKDVTWSLNSGGVLTISGSGAMANYSSLSAIPWSSYISNITSVVIGDGVTTIGNDAFNDCSSLVSVYVMATTPPTLGTDAFSTAASGLKIYVPANSGDNYKNGWPAYESIIEELTASGYCGDTSVNGGKNVIWSLTDGGALTISGTGAMADFGDSYSKAPWLSSYKNNITSVVIGEGVTSIGDFAFYECEYLASASIPASVTSICQGAFKYCGRSATALTVTFATGSSLTTIGNGAFNGAKLSSISIPASVTSIGEGAFDSCYYLTTIDIPASVTSIGAGAFWGCGHNVTTLTVTFATESSLTTIGILAFAYANLNSITIPASVISIDESAFSFCENLTTIDIPASVTSIGICTFYECTNLTSVTLHSNPFIGDNAFPASATVTMNLTANSAGGAKWMTFYNQNYSFEADVNTQVFKVELSGDEVKLHEIENKIVEATAAVVLKSTGNPVMTKKTNVSSNNNEPNSLSGVAVPAGEKSLGNMYVLNDGTHGVGFYKLTYGKTLGVGKAYLQYGQPESGGGQTREFLGFTDMTGINDVRCQKEDVRGEYYDLQGRRVSQPTKGLYIVNGKKVVIK